MVDDSPALIELRACRVDLRTRSVLREDRGARLSTKEAELLEYLASHASRAIPREELLQEVWGYDPSVVSRTADTTVQRLRSKIERDPRQPEHILTEHGLGYRFEPLLEGAEGPSLPAPTTGDNARTNLTPDPTAFVGRERDLERIREALGTHRLVTLRGPGGAGKTRLARRSALDALRDGLPGENLTGGAYFVDLAPATNEDAVVRAVASAIALSLVLDGGRHDPASQVGHAVADRGPVLLVFDNCEQVVAPAAALAARICELAPDLRILATSRESLRLAGERILEIGPLSREEAIELFTVRARAVRPDFRVEDEVTLGELVDALDRLPLALELAAARSGLLSPDRMVDRLTERFKLLSRGPRDAVPRHRTLRATIDWSWDLLEPEEQRALAWCSVFRGAFPVEAAEAVLTSALGDDSFVLDLLETLRERSLVRAVTAPEDPDTPRMRLFESVRAYAEDRLVELGEAEQALERHQAWMLDHGGELAEQVDGVGGEGAMARLGLLLDDLLAVHRRCLQTDPEASVRAALAAVAWLHRQGPMSTHQELLEASRRVAVEAGLSPGLRAQVALRASRALRHQGRPDEGEEAAREAIALAEEADDPRLRGVAMVALSVQQRNRGRTAESEALVREALALHEKHGHRIEARRARGSLAFTAWKQGRFVEAEDLYKDVLAEARRDEDHSAAANALSSLGLVLMDQGRVTSAEPPMVESLELSRMIRDRRAVAVAAGNLARLAVTRGRIKEARAWYQECLLGLRAMGDRRLEGVVNRNLGVLALSKGLARKAEEHFRFALAVSRETDDQWNVGLVLSDLGEVLMHEERFAEAEVRYAEALEKAVEVGDQRGAAITRGNLSVLHHLRGELDAAEEYSATCLAALDELGLKRPHGYFLCYAAMLAAERGELDAAEERMKAARETLHPIGDLKANALADLCASGVALAVARKRGTTEQREVAEEKAEQFAEDPDPDVSSDTLHAADTSQGRRLLRRLIEQEPG